MKKKKKTDPSTANEPMAEYGDKKIVFFKSFEEMNEYDDREMARLSPEERLSNITWFIKRAYAKELSKKMDLTVHFK